LPQFEGEDEWCNSKLLGGQSTRAAKPMPSTTLHNRYYHMLWNVAAVYYLPQRFQTSAHCDNGRTYYRYNSPDWYWGFHKQHSEGDLKKAMQWYNNIHRGIYYVNTVSYKDYYGKDIEVASMMVPYYQIPLMTGSQYGPGDIKGLTRAVPSLKNTYRANQRLSTQLLYLWNRDAKTNYTHDRDKYLHPEWVDYNYVRYNPDDAIQRIKSIRMGVYRVNAFNTETMNYDCLLLRPDRYSSTEYQVYQSTNTSSNWLFRNWRKTTGTKDE